MAAEMSDVRLEWHLDNWSRYIKNDASEIAAIGYPSHSVGFLNGGGVSDDNTQIIYDQIDINCAQTMDAIIDSLDAHLQCAINHRWTAAVWKMRDFEAAYAEACRQIKIMAAKRNLI